MSGQQWSWSKALEAGTLTEMQLETLQATVDDGDAADLFEAASLLDYDATRRVGDEPGPFGA